MPHMTFASVGQTSNHSHHSYLTTAFRDFCICKLHFVSPSFESTWVARQFWLFLPFLDFAQSQDYPHTLLCLILSARRKKDNIHLSTIFTMQQKHIKYLAPGTQLTKILIPYIILYVLQHQMSRS